MVPGRSTRRENPKRRNIRNRICAAGIICGNGVIGIEFVSHLYLKTHDIDTLGYNLLTALEEGLEMAGVMFFIHALMKYLKTIPALKFPSHRSASWTSGAGGRLPVQGWAGVTTR